MNNTRTFRSIWISDFHLGTPDAKSSYLLDFLRVHESEYLYLVGDILDGWALKRSWYWTQTHNDIIQKLMRKARKGTNVFYIPGNHDEFAREYLGVALGHIAIRSEVFHKTADDKTFLVLHGDEFDGVMRNARWLSMLGSTAYRWALRLNRWLNAVRVRMGKPYWSLSATLKYKTKRAVQFIAQFETAVSTEAKRCGVDGVVCGHIHHPEIREIDGILYANCGDWVESCTALVEHFDGRLELIRWTDELYKVDGVDLNTALRPQPHFEPASEFERVSVENDPISVKDLAIGGLNLPL